MAAKKVSSTWLCSGGWSALFALLPPEHTPLKYLHKSRQRVVCAVVLICGQDARMRLAPGARWSSREGSEFRDAENPAISGLLNSGRD